MYSLIKEIDPKTGAAIAKLQWVLSIRYSSKPDMSELYFSALFLLYWGTAVATILLPGHFGSERRLQTTQRDVEACIES